MKVLKKYFKVVMCFMAFALCSFLMVFAPTMTVLAAESSITNYSKTINSVKMPKVIDVENEDELVIPVLTGDFAANGYAIKVVDPAGSIHTCKVASNGNFVTETVEQNEVTHNDNGYFEKVATGFKVTALTNGNYQIVYVVTSSDVEYFSNVYNVTVKNVSYELDFTNVDGSKNLVPSQVKTSSAEADRISIPVPAATIVGSDAEGAKLLENEISVSWNGTNINPAATGSDFVKVNVGTEQDPEYKYYIQPSKAGIYKIQYTYKRGVNRPTKTITIKVSDDFKTPTGFAVSTVPTFDKFELGQKDVTLPKLVAKNEYESNVDYNLKSIKIEKESDSTIYQVLENNSYTFDMTLEAFEGVNADDSYDKLKGNYIITYTLEGAYKGSEKNEITYTKRIENVTVSSKPTIKMAYDYTATGSMKEGNFVVTGEVDTDASTQLQNKYGYDEIILPAAYAEDLVSDSDELMVVRYLRNVNSSTIYYVDNLKYNSETNTLEEVEENSTGYNYSGDANIGNINKAVKFSFASTAEKSKTYDGTYQLEYRVIAKNVAKRENTLTISGSTKYTFTVLSYSLEEYKATTPSVEITNVINNSSVDKAEDLVVNFTAKDDDDTRLKKTVYYYYGNKSAANLATEIKNLVSDHNTDRTMHVLDRESLLEELADAGYTGITIAEYSEEAKGYVVKFDTTTDGIKDATSAVVVAVAYNDYNNIDVDSKIVTFKNTIEEDVPTATIVNTGDFNADCSALVNTVKMGDVVTLPTIQYADTADSTLQTNVVYYVNTPVSESAGIKYLSPSKKNYISNKVVGGQIVIEQAGDYVVVYSAIDDAGNTTINHFTFNVESNTKPLLSVNAEGKDLTISGNSITAEVGSAISFNTVVRDGDSKEVVNGSVEVEIEDDGLVWGTSGDKELSYVFNSVGKATFKFTAKYDGKESVEKIVYVNIKAKELKWLDEFNIPEYADTEEDIYLPDVSASDNAVVKVTVTPPNNSKLDGEVEKVSKDKDGNVGSFWHFTTNSTKGNYKVTYTATTADATLEKTFTIKVGDNVPPTIEFEHKAELEQDIVYDGSNQIKIKFDVKKTGELAKRYFKITATSNGETIYSYDLGLKITDTDGASTSSMFWTDLVYEITGDNSVLTKENDNEYLISGTGKFTINLKISDNNGNETVEPIVFNVVSESEADDESDTVVGIVLIVISLVVLAGVILFFMFTGKKGGSKKTKKVKTAKTEKTKEVKEEVKVEETPVVEEAAEEVESTEENTEAKEGEIEE